MNCGAGTKHPFQKGVRKSLTWKEVVTLPLLKLLFGGISMLGSANHPRKRKEGLRVEK
jgi:hypothetical protein